MVKLLIGNATLIIILAYVLFAGIGIGAAITDALIEKGEEMKYRTPSTKNEYYLPKHTYLACVHYALQYRDWRSVLSAERDTRGAIRYDKERVQTSHDYDSTSTTAIRMIDIQAKVDMIDQIIDEICEEGMRKYLRKAVCYGFTVYQLQDEGMPCGKNYITKLRQKFYFKLSQKI